MREIKFRAWHKTKKAIYSIELDDYFGHYYASHRFGGRFEFTFRQESGFGEHYVEDAGLDNIDDLIFMQFTGLKDKNGKDIFEGDIVKWAWQNPREVIYTHNHGWHPRNIFNLDWWKDSEVIGNIYDEPTHIGKKE